MCEEVTIVPWDTELIGNNVYEINYKNNFTFNELKKIDDFCYENKAHLSFIKVNGSDINTIHSLEKLGFNYIESQFEMRKEMKKKYELPHYDKLFSLSLVEISDTDSVKAICDIAKSTFDTDRYYIDPKIDNKISGKRYCNWILNSLGDEAYNLYEYKSRKTDEVVSFYLTKNDRTRIYLALQGVSPSMKGKGISLSMLIDYFNSHFAEGKNSFYTFVSGINRDALNEHIYLGFRIVNQTIVLRKYY